MSFRQAEVTVQADLGDITTHILFASEGDNSSSADRQIEWLEGMHLNDNRADPAEARRNTACAWQETPHPRCQIQLIHL